MLQRINLSDLLYTSLVFVVHVLIRVTSIQPLPFLGIFQIITQTWVYV